MTKLIKGNSYNESDLNLDGVAQEIESYSITPRTFVTRTFEITGILETQKDWPYYVDEYRHLNNQVTRFGIDSGKINAASLNNNLVKAKTSLSQSTSQTSSSLNKSSSSSYTPEEAKNVQLHELEVYLTKKAIMHLLDSDADRHSVIVDIFAREIKGANKGAIKKIGDHPETHAIVLYKNPNIVDQKHEIIVIDPSNFVYSSHLSNLNGILQESSGFEIKTLHKSIQIYNATDAVGPHANQYRDCIDLSVKLAFGMNKALYDINLKDIAKYDVVKAISNQDKINDAVIKDYPFRIKQTSDIQVLKAFYAVEQQINHTVQVLSAAAIHNPKQQQRDLLTEQYNSLRQKYTDFANNETLIGQEILSELLSLNKEYVQKLSIELFKEHYALDLLIGATTEDS